MASFVHVTAEEDLARIRRSGLRPGRGQAGVYAVPVTPDFMGSHQWLREIGRWKCGRRMAAVYFRIPGGTPVVFGRYNQHHTAGTADEAVAALLAAADPLGFETIVQRAVRADEITSVKAMRQITGWRYFPAAKGRPPFCTCDYCQRGQPFSRRLRKTAGA